MMLASSISRNLKIDWNHFYAIYINVRMSVFCSLKNQENKKKTELKPKETAKTRPQGLNCNFLVCHVGTARLSPSPVRDD